MEGVRRGRGRPKIRWREAVLKNLQFLNTEVELVSNKLMAKKGKKKKERKKTNPYSRR